MIRYHLVCFRLPDGDDGIRTHDPLLAGQVLSQLSYTPILNAECGMQSAKLLGFAFLRFKVNRERYKEE